jgi:hypothetical protein
MFIMHEMCGVKTDNYDKFHWKQAMFAKGIIITFANNLKFGTSFVASLCGSFGSNVMTKSSTTKQWHESKVKHRIWDELIMYAKAEAPRALAWW